MDCTGLGSQYKAENVVELIEAQMSVVITGMVSLSAWYLDVHFVFATSHFIFQDQLKIQYMYLTVKAEYYLTVSMSVEVMRCTLHEYFLMDFWTLSPNCL